jgi:hypothetical protein
MRGFRLAAIASALASLLCAGVAARGQNAQGTPTPEADERLARILSRVGDSVERYQRGMFSLRFTETVRREELREDLTPKRSKEYVYDSVMVRENLSKAEGDYLAHTSSTLKSVDGRAAKGAGEGRSAGEEFNPNHMDFLNFLLPKFQSLYRFSFEGEETLRGRRTFRVGALRRGQDEPHVEWEGRSFIAFGPMKTTFWVDAETFDVLQLESHLVSEFEFESPRAFSAGPLGHFGPSRKLRYKREDYLIRFRAVTFRSPDQTLLLPEYAEWLKVIEGASRPRLRATATFTNYQRFVSDVRVIEDQNE